MNLDEAFNTFLAESREMLEEMERLLLELELCCEGNHDAEQLNALFRCVHTIKGAAGLFGLDAVVTFTHVVENILDRLRDGQVQLSVPLSALLLRCRDHIAALIELAPREAPRELIAVGESLLAQLAEQEPEGASGRDGGARVPQALGEQCWHISLRFSADVLRSGLDPLGFIRYLATLGEIRYVATSADALPPAEQMDPESCYLGFEIDLQADTDKATIEEVFAFVRDDCALRILPPGSAIEQYIELIQALPEDEERLGQILIASGA